MNRTLIYCDPPYKDTAGYKSGAKKTDFNHEEYYDWVRQKVSEGHIVLCSEYTMPEDFICIFKKDIFNQMNKNKTNSTEKLFIHQSQLEIFKRSFPSETVI